MVPGMVEIGNFVQMLEIETNLAKLKKAISEKSELDPATINIKSFQMEF